MKTLADLHELHDFSCVRCALSEAAGTLELECKEEQGEKVYLVRFHDVMEADLVDIAMGSILDEIEEVKKESWSCVAGMYHLRGRNKRSIADVILPAEEGRGAGFRLWQITSSYGLHGLILARRLSIVCKKNLPAR